MGKIRFGIRPVWYKSKDMERIKDVYRGTTVYIYIYIYRLIILQCDMTAEIQKSEPEKMFIIRQGLGK
jgi:hypothetical protein